LKSTYCKTRKNNRYNGKLVAHSDNQKEYIDCYLLKTCNASFPYGYEQLPARWREIWNITPLLKGVEIITIICSTYCNIE